MVILGMINVLLETGLIYSLLAMGYYVTYTLLDFPDLTVEGTFLSGAVVWGLLVHAGLNPWLALVAAFIMGALCGALTGVLHVKLHIRPLLCGILVSTLLITVNLVLTSGGVAGDFTGGGASTISFNRNDPTLHNSLPFSLIPAKIGNVSVRDLVMFLAIALLFKLLLDAFLKTRRGLLLRATGNNQQFVLSLAKDAGKNKILGLAIGNAYAAVAGVMFANYTLGVNQSMGIGSIVIGLASLIIGLSLLSKIHFMRDTTKVIIGAIVYQACLVVVNQLGVPSAYNKLVMAVLFVAALVLSEKKSRRKKAEA